MLKQTKKKEGNPTNAFVLFLTFFVLATFCRADSIPIAPAPWNLTVSEAYAFVVAPPPSLHPLEASELAPGVILPDSGLIMILRYSASPVDDELIYIPGRWAYNLTDSGLRITRIYVTTNASVFNGKDSLSACVNTVEWALSGRANWNIPSRPTNPVEVGTTTWKQTWTATVISGALPGGKIGNGIGYPDIQPWSGPLIFPVPSIVPNL
ncbi:hypothetical protein B0H14DRAFT_2723732 [Mycena olivaceomarginata]|nr:hypothetical protein B0H14DRAFT_2723732 [Mycena olivaceomarginata]